jgi:hypothetical protein
MPRELNFAGRSRDSPNENRKRRSTSEVLVSRPRKTQRQRFLVQPSEPRVLCNLSSDTLHHIFGFFLSDAGKVDGDTLRSAMLVSKQWNEVATSTSLWKMKNASNTDPIESALCISEVDNSGDDSVSDGDEKPERLSLVGFIKISQINDGFGDNSIVYRAKERSQGTQCLIAVSPKNKRPNMLLNHIFEGSLFQGGSEFLDHPEKKDAFARMRKHYPLRTILVGEHVVRWYEDGDMNSILPPQICVPSPVPNPEVPKSFRVLETLVADHRHLRSLERRQKSEITNYLSRRSWAMIVDWLVEITQCLNLERRVPFHAMELFRRFVSNIKASLPLTSHDVFLATIIYPG